MANVDTFAVCLPGFDDFVALRVEEIFKCVFRCIVEVVIHCIATPTKGLTLGHLTLLNSP